MSRAVVPDPPPAPVPAISVIVPVYNREKLIADTLESVLAQSFDDFEVVVVDDGSTDGTVETVKAFAARDPRIRYVLQENGGPGAARNRGIIEARAEWIAFLDSDDRWTPEKLSNAKRLIDDDGRIDFVHSNYRAVYPGGVLSKPRDAPPYEKLSSKTFLVKTFSLRTSTVLMKRVLLDRIGGYFYTEPRNYQDFHLFWRAVIKAEAIGYVPSCDTLLFRTHPGVARFLTDTGNTRLKILAMSRVRDWIQENDLPAEYAQILSMRIYREFQKLFGVLIRNRALTDLNKELWNCSRLLSWPRAVRGIASSFLDAVR